MTRVRAFVIAQVLSIAAIASSPSLAIADAPPKTPPPDPLNPFPAPSPKIVPQPDQSYSYAQPFAYPSLPWLGMQLIPSPEVAFGATEDGPIAERVNKTAFGLRWQVTPVLWSWGTNRRVSRWRYLVVDPLARHSGSIELSGTLEYLWGHIDRFLARPGLRAYFPLLQRGEYLSASLGTSTYAYDEKMRVAYDVGVYGLAGLFGLQATVAPYHGPLSAIATFRIRYF